MRTRGNSPNGVVEMRRSRSLTYARAAVSTLLAGIFTLAVGSVSAAELYKEDAYADYKPDLKNGEYLYNAGACSSCHGSAENPDLLAGGLKMDSFVGSFHVPNITSGAKGIGSWSNAAFLNALLNGVSPKGRHYYPVFPYTNYAGMKPEDALDIKGYLATLPQSDNVAPKHKVSFPYNLNSMMSFWKRRNFKTARWTPGKDDQLARGKYLVENVGACGSCHTPRSTTYGTLDDKPLEGSKGLTGAYAPAINASILAKLPNPEVFTKGTLVDGNKLNGQPIVDPVMRAIVKQTAKLSEEDRLAMYAYITGGEIKTKEPPKPTVELVTKTCTGDLGAAAPAGGGGIDPALSADADNFIGQYCRNCHGPGESSQGSFPAGDLASIAADASFVTPGDPNASRMYTSITSGRMPIGSKPSAGEVARLAEWITALGSPEATAAAAQAVPAGPPPRARKILRREDFVQAALNDLSKQDELDRKHLRYFSYRSHYNGRFPCESDEKYAERQKFYVAGFNKFVNSVSLGTELVLPDVVANTKDLLIRVDIRDLGWEPYQWDILVNAYPYGVDPYGDPTLLALTKETHTPLPIMRTDWFIATASRPAFYHALLRLPKNIRELERGRLGLNVEENISRGKVIRAAFDRGASGVSAHNRMIERHAMPQGGYYWKSYDFAGSFNRQSLRDYPHGPEDIEPLKAGLKSFEHDGGEMIFSLPNGLQGYYLSDHKGNRIDEGPEKIVSYQERPKDKAPTIINGRSCFDCHADGILTKRDNMRQHLQTTNQFDVEQTRLLLAMYIEQAEMDDFYDADRDKFVAALEKIGATEQAISGKPKSIVAPGDKEIITWYADLYEDNLDLESFAAEFDMEAEEFKSAVLRINDVSVQQLAMQKILQLEGGAKVPRFEIEQQYPYLQESLTGHKPLSASHVAEYVEKYGEKVAYKEPVKKEAVKKEGYVEPKKEVVVAEVKKEVYAEQAYKAGPVEKKAEVYKAVVPQYQQKEYVDGDKLKLAIYVEKTQAKVGEKLSFTVESSHDCEIQILYVESSGHVEEFPYQLIGDPWLRAHKPRRIPAEGSGHIEFDEPGHSESLIVYCHTAGLGVEKLTLDAARKIAASSSKPATRGISFKLAKKVEKEKGKSAFHVVSFDVTH